MLGISSTNQLYLCTIPIAITNLLTRVALCNIGLPPVFPGNIHAIKPSTISPIGSVDKTTLPGSPNMADDPRLLSVGLSITVFNGTYCTGAAVKYEVAYQVKVPWQVQSYQLSRNLCPAEILDFWNALPQGGPLNVTYEGNDAACSTLIRMAEGDERKKACNTLEAALGCMRVWESSTTSESTDHSQPSLQTGSPSVC